MDFVVEKSLKFLADLALSGFEHPFFLIKGDLLKGWLHEADILFG